MSKWYIPEEGDIAIDEKTQEVDIFICSDGPAPMEAMENVTICETLPAPSSPR